MQPYPAYLKTLSRRRKHSSAYNASSEAANGLVFQTLDSDPTLARLSALGKANLNVFKDLGICNMPQSKAPEQSPLYDARYWEPGSKGNLQLGST